MTRFQTFGKNCGKNCALIIDLALHSLSAPKFRILRCIALKHEEINFNDLPETINKEQFYKICHIGKSTALYLLQSGKVPCRSTGKKTRCYRINKEDVIFYLKNRETFPEFYRAPYGLCLFDADKHLSGSLSTDTLSKMHDYYSDLLSGFPDVLTTVQLSELTGYGKNCVYSWCRKGHLSSIKHRNANIIPKIFVIDFLCSDYFRSISRKSRWHIQTLNSFYLGRNACGLKSDEGGGVQ